MIGIALASLERMKARVLLALAFALTPGITHGEGGANGGDGVVPDFSGDYIRFFFYAPPVSIDWSTPARAAWTTVETNLVFEPDYSEPSHPVRKAHHAIGHSNVDLHCEGEEEAWSGMTDTDVSVEIESFLGGAGVDATFLDEPGRFYRREEILDELPDFFENGRMTSITVLVNHSACERMLEYRREYEEKHLNETFGGLLGRPRYGEPTGCTNYALSYLEVAGIMDDALRSQLMRSLHVPYKLIGHFPERMPRGHDLLGLAFRGMLGFDSTPWASEETASFPLRFYDPELAYAWVRKLNHDGEWLRPDGSTRVVQTYAIQNTVNLVADATDIPVPDEPIWLDPATNPPPHW